MSAKKAHQGIGMTSQRTRSRLVARLAEAGIKNQCVLTAIEDLPRHLFIDEAIAHRAYEDSALPIGMGQTISQPYIVAKMTETLLAGSERSMNKVLEVGTGCGYQAAVLARLVAHVVTLERIAALQVKAKALLAEINVHNVDFYHRDGWQGFPPAAPYDGIIVTAAPEQIPDALLEQLHPEGGRMVVPVGVEGRQELKLIERQENDFQETLIERVRFVPLVAGAVI